MTLISRNSRLDIEAYHKHWMRMSSFWTDRTELARLTQKEVAVQELSRELRQNEIILGFDGLEYDPAHAVYQDIHKTGGTGEVRAYHAIFMGLNGSGKTGLGKNVVFQDNLVQRFLEPFFMYDKKGEAPESKKPSFSSASEEAVRKKVDSLFAKFNPPIHRHGYDILTVAPVLMKPKGGAGLPGVDRYFGISLDMLKFISRHDPDECTRIFMMLIGEDPNNPNSVDIIKRLIRGHLNNVQKYAEMVDLVERISMKQGLVNTGGRIQRKIKNARYDRVLSDRTEDQLDILNEMWSRRGKGGVAFRGRARSSGSESYIDMQFDAMLMTLMWTILYDSGDYHKFRSPTAVLRSQNGTAIYIPELHSLAPDGKFSYTTDFIRPFLTEARTSGIDFGGDTQEASTVDKEFFSQFRYIYCCGAVTENNAKVLVQHHIRQEIINNVLRELDGRKKTSIGMEPPESAAIETETKDYKTFRVMPSQSGWQAMTKA